MALRFRTRLTLVISFLVFLTVSVVTLGFIGILVQRLGTQYKETGEMMNQLANRNISYSAGLPARVTERVEAQMLVSALLTAEMVAFAQEPGAATDEEISAALRRVIERSRAVYGVPLVDEFWVTDEDGTSTINSTSAEFDFNAEGDGSEQAREFLSLLTPGASPVIQELRDRTIDGKRFKYVGVGGVDQPRIVAVGASEDLMRLAISDFEVQDFIERFNEGNLFRRVAVVTEGGELVAAVGPEGATSLGDEYMTDLISRSCRSYLRKNVRTPEFMSIEGDIGVVTRLDTRRNDKPLALFIQHPVEESFETILQVVGLVALIGSIIIMIGFLVSIFLGNGLSKPIVALAKGAREFGAGNLNYRLYWKRKDEFQSLAQSFNTMAISLQEYMHELELETSRRERLESEMRIASEMQQSLLPETPPEVPGLELFGWSKPSKDVGGDSFDFIVLDGNKVAVVLGDATGKGISAALLITQCWSILHTLSSDIPDPADLLARTNREFHRRIGATHKFVTLFLVIVDMKTGEAAYSTAGHPPPLLVNGKTGEHRWLPCKPSFPLGIVEETSFCDERIRLAPGDTIVLYSDGVSDAHGPDNELYGEERMEQALVRLGDKPLHDMIDGLYNDTVKHMAGREAIDDMTLVGLRYLGPEAREEALEMAATADAPE